VYDTPLTPEQLLPRLAAAPGRIAALTEGLTPAELRAAPPDGGWSALDVLAHLRACSDVWGGCIARLLAEERPAFRAVNPTSWIKQTNYRDLEFGPSLRAFADQRAGLLAVLEALSPDDWSRAGTVTGVGRAFERTVLSYARWLANHERSHDRQFARVADAARGARDAT
jgi:hypothetical protein